MSRKWQEAAFPAASALPRSRRYPKRSSILTARPIDPLGVSEARNSRTQLTWPYIPFLKTARFRSSGRNRQFNSTQPKLTPVHEVLARTPSQNVPAQAMQILKNDRTFHLPHLARRFRNHAIQSVAHAVSASAVLAHAVVAAQSSIASAGVKRLRDLDGGLDLHEFPGLQLQVAHRCFL